MKIKIFDIKWSTKTAGPSPYNNERTELFFFGCKKALEGNPCIGCFNPDLWDCSKAIYDYTPEEIAFKIKEYAPNKYITIGGGEPTDQIDGLIELTRLLKAMDFNIMVYTYKDISNIIDPTEKSKINMLLNNINLLIDGEYDYREHMYRENKEDGFLNSIGSGNQTIWINNYNIVNSTKIIIGHKMKDVKSLYFDDNNNLIIKRKQNKNNPISYVIEEDN